MRCYICSMDRIDLNRDHPSLDELLARAQADGLVEIVKDGAIVATVTKGVAKSSVEQPKKTFDFDALAVFTDSIRRPGPLPESAVVQMRRDYRY